MSDYAIREKSFSAFLSVEKPTNLSQCNLKLFIPLQLVPLRANDNVYMKIEPYTWFENNPDTMFLALIKLNDDLLQLPNGPNGPDYRG